MSQVHNALERGGDLTAAIKDALGATDSEGGLERFGETMTPVIDIWTLPEWAFLRNEKLCAIVRTTPAVVGEFSAAAIVNPTGSRVIAVVEKASWDAGTVTVVQLQMTDEATILATLGTSAKGNVRDRRWPTPLSACNILHGSDLSATIGVNLESRRKAAADTIDFFSLPCVLAPGTGLLIVGQTVNVAGNVNFVWRERSVFSAELG